MKMKRKGFTLIEMLVVIAIIGVLAAMLAGPLMNARTQALKTACTNNLAQIGKASFMYESQNDGKAPNYTAAAITSDVQTLWPLLAIFRVNLLDSPKIVTCPVGSATNQVYDQTGAGIMKDSNTATSVLTVTAGGTYFYSHYLFTTYYTAGSPGNRVIAGDAGGAASATTGFSRNHGDASLAAATQGANALFKDGHVKGSKPDYTVEGAARASTNSNDVNLWGTNGVASATSTGTCIGTLGS